MSPDPPRSNSPATTLSVAAKRRAAGLKALPRAALVEVSRAHARGDLSSAWVQWTRASLAAPGHAEVLRWAATLHEAAGEYVEAIDATRKAIEQHPEDPELLRQLGRVLAYNADDEGALRALREAAECTTSYDDWFALAIVFDQQGWIEDSLRAVDAALRISPGAPRAQLLRARCLQALGDAPAAAAECRRVIASGSDVAAAWFALLDLKTVTLDETQLAQLAHAYKRAATTYESSLLGFALARAYEVHGDHRAALALFTRVNDAIADVQRWNSARFAADVESMVDAFSGIAPGRDPALGENVVFIVGMPRSGSTLVEQVLARHPDVEAASELPTLEQVIAVESARRRKPLAHWAREATPAEWARLGQEYLRRTARWRRQRRVSTDKCPGNWLLAGALRVMLPGAHIVDCRRDPLETSWSCYKQLFATGKADFSYRFEDLAAYSHSYRRAADRWSQQHRSHYGIFNYEELVADADSFVRRLLAFCALAFDSRCLQPHEAVRAVRTASSAQVREPIRRVALRGDAYGAGLDPLRELLSR